MQTAKRGEAANVCTACIQRSLLSLLSCFHTPSGTQTGHYARHDFSLFVSLTQTRRTASSRREWRRKWRGVWSVKSSLSPASASEQEWHHSRRRRRRRQQQRRRPRRQWRAALAELFMRVSGAVAKGAQCLQKVTQSAALCVFSKLSHSWVTTTKLKPSKMRFPSQ